MPQSLKRIRKCATKCRVAYFKLSQKMIYNLLFNFYLLYFAEKNHFIIETFHVVSECKTAVYFSWCLIHSHAQQYNCFNHWFMIGVASSDSFPESDLQFLIETEQDQTRQPFKQ